MIRALAPVPPEPPKSRRRKLATAAAGVLLGLLALAALRAARTGEADRHTLISRVAAVGIERADLAKVERAVLREGDPSEARTVAARLLVEREVQRPGTASAGLALARDLAREALERQPANAEASWILGATISMIRARERDTRLFSLSKEWESPIRRSIALAPNARDPRRMLVGAYLDVWPALSSARRAEATGLLREAFEDRLTFQRLIGPWFEIAGSLPAAATLVPDRSWAWSPFVERAARQRDWPAFVDFDGRQRRAERQEIEAAIAEADADSAAGDSYAARTGFDQALVRLQPDGAVVPALERLLARRPAGPAADKAAQAAVAWLGWAEPLELLGRESLSGEALARLSSLAGGRLPLDRAALVALAAGDLSRAELLERRSDSLWSERWAPYLVLKAERALDRKATAEARAALEQAHRDYRKRLAWRRLAREAGLATAAPEAERWEASDWVWSEGAARLELQPAFAATGLRLKLEGVGAEGAVLEPILDGRRLAAVVVAGGAREALVALPLAAEAHLFELRIRSGTARPAPAVDLVR